MIPGDPGLFQKRGMTAKMNPKDVAEEKEKLWTPGQEAEAPAPLPVEKQDEDAPDEEAA